MALIWGGIFLTDPAAGFPPSTSPGADQLSWHGLLHAAAPTVAGLALDAACLVFARRYLAIRRPGWAAYCLLTVAADLGTATTAALTHDFRWLLLGGALTWGFASVIAGRLIVERREALTRPDRSSDPGSMSPSRLTRVPAR